MSKTIKKKQEIIIRIVKPYYDDPSTRSITLDATCKYRGAKGRECAFAKCVLPEAKSLLKEGNSAIHILNEIEEKKLLLPEYVDVFCKLEWQIIQNLHDYCDKEYIEKLEEYIERLNKEFGYTLSLSDFTSDPNNLPSISKALQWWRQLGDTQRIIVFNNYQKDVEVLNTSVYDLDFMEVVRIYERYAVKLT